VAKDGINGLISKKTLMSQIVQDEKPLEHIDSQQKLSNHPNHPRF